MPTDVDWFGSGGQACGNVINCLLLIINGRRRLIQAIDATYNSIAVLHKGLMTLKKSDCFLNGMPEASGFMISRSSKSRQRIMRKITLSL